MPRIEEYDYPHSHFTPEPHCIPGYTGYLPGFGPHKLYQFGKTYGRMTHDIMAGHPVAGERFGNILYCERDDHLPSNASSSAWDEDRKNNRSDKMSGYTGHVPRKNFYCGKGYQEECRRGVTDFGRLQRERRDTQAGAKYFPPEDLLPRTMLFPKRLCERPEHRNIPSYATFTNPMNYGMSVYDMSDLDPRKTYMPGYTGYYTGKYFDTGVTHSNGAHQDLCDLTSSKLERLVAERRPKINEWYCCPVLSAPEVVPLDGYHPPLYKPSRPLPGYAGHVPGYRDCCTGERFGQSAGTILREKELMYYSGPRKP